MEKRDENGLAVRLYGYEQDLYFSACPPGGTEDRLLFYVTHILKTDFLSIGCRIDIRDTFRQPCQKQRKKKSQDSHRYYSCKNCSAGIMRAASLFFVPLHRMKLFVLIFSFLLTFFSGGRTEVVSTHASGGSLCRVSECPSAENPADFTQNREICITAAQGYAFAGNNSSNSVSVRLTQSGKRTSPQVRSAFRMVKGGKIIDNNHLHPFLARSFVHLAGIYMGERYLFSICRLRL